MYFKGIPKCLFGQVFFFEAWGAKAKKPHMFLKMCGLLALPPSAAKLNNHFCRYHQKPSATKYCFLWQVEFSKTKIQKQKKTKTPLVLLSNHSKLKI